jgi:hypothetical protein
MCDGCVYVISIHLHNSIKKKIEIIFDFRNHQNWIDFFPIISLASIPTQHTPSGVEKGTNQKEKRIFSRIRIKMLNLIFVCLYLQ